MMGQLILATFLLTSGWQTATPAGVVSGKSWSAAYCISHYYYAETESILLPEPLCFADDYRLHIGPASFQVTEDVWQETAVSDFWPGF